MTPLVHQALDYGSSTVPVGTTRNRRSCQRCGKRPKFPVLFKLSLVHTETGMQVLSVPMGPRHDWQSRYTDFKTSRQHWHCQLRACLQEPQLLLPTQQGLRRIGKTLEATPAHHSPHQQHGPELQSMTDIVRPWQPRENSNCYHHAGELELPSRL
jgi:hypothetical protein